VPDNSPLLLIAIAVAAVAIIVAGVLWLRHRAEVARRREAELARQRERERARASGGRALKFALDTAARVRERGLGEGVLGSIEDLAGWAESEQPDLNRIAARDGTVTILFSDIEDSTSMNEQMGDRAWLKILGAHDSIVREHVQDHGGHIVKSQGDGFMVAFRSPGEALGCAVEIQRALLRGNRRLRRTPIRVRIGIHVGEAVAKDGDLFGRNVALAARVAGEANGGEILVSPAVVEAAGETGDVSFAPRDEVELKGLPGTHRLAVVQWEGEQET
jgi:adenylate cyclase